MKKTLFVILLMMTSYFVPAQEKTDCTEWDYYKTECLSNVPDGTGSSEAGIRRRVCKISETSSRVTVEATIEPINGGIDSRVKFYKGISISFRGQNKMTLSKEEFNKGGAITKTITLNKSDLQDPYLKLFEAWNKNTVMLFVSAECVNE